MPRDPPSERSFFINAYTNLTACYEETNIGSAIGEWILQDRARQDFTYVYFNSLRRRAGQSNGHNDHGPVDISAFLPHALVLLVMIVVISHMLHFFLRHLGQSRFVSQMIAGILIYLFWNKGRHVDSIDHYMLLHPKNRRLEEAFASIGMFFNLFLVGLKIDPSSAWRAGKKPFMIAVTSISIPVLITFLAYLCIHNKIGYLEKSKHDFLLFVIGIICHSFVFVQAEVLSELGLLGSELGRLALSASLIQDFMLYSSFPVFNSITQSRIGGKNIVMDLLFFAIMISFIILVVRPYALWIVQNTPSHAHVREVHITLITILVILMALASDIIGAQDIAGPVIMGLAMPSGPPLGTALIRQLDLVATELLLPMSFIIAGREMDWAAAGHELSHGLWLGMLTLISSITKVVTLVISAAYFGSPLKNGALLGLTMNFKGIIETFILIEFRSGGAISGATYTYLILLILAVTSISSFLVAMFYKPLDKEFIVYQNVRDLKTQSELRIITSFFNDKPIASLLDLFEWLTSFRAKHCTCVYALHLTELKARSKSNLIGHHKGKDQIDTTEMNPIHNHLVTFAQKKKDRVTVLPFTSIVPQENLHQDICSLIVERTVALAILPFPRKNSMADAEADQRERGLIPIVLEQAQCSVGIMVYHSLTRITQTLQTHQSHIGVLFMGGPDDREAVAIAGRMAYHPYVHLSILRFLVSSDIKGIANNMEEIHAKEQKLDDEVIGQLLVDNVGNDRLAIREVTIDDPVQIILAIRSLGDNYDMLIVGRRLAHSSPLDNEALVEWIETPELGVIGDLLASPDFKTSANILVVQQHGSR